MIGRLTVELEPSLVKKLEGRWRWRVPGALLTAMSLPHTLLMLYHKKSWDADAVKKPETPFDKLVDGWHHESVQFQEALKTGKEIVAKIVASPYHRGGFFCRLEVKPVASFEFSVKPNGQIVFLGGPIIC